MIFFFSSRRRHTRYWRDWSSDVCSSDLYFDNYTDAYRILEKYDMKGTFFVITNYVNQDGMYMNLNMLKEMKAHGMDIQSHTADHKRLNWRGREAQTKAINDAKIGRAHV